MALTGYQVLPPIDLAASAGRVVPVVSPGTDVYALSVLQAPPNFSASFKAGNGGQLAPLPNQGQGFKICPTSSEGIFVSVPVGQAGQLILAINLEFSGSAPPRDPVLAGYGKANQVGSVNAGPTVQLYNDVGSGRILRVHSVLVASGVNGRVGGIRSGYKLTGSGGGALTQGAKQYLDSRQVDGNLKALIQGATFDNGLIGGTGVIAVGLYIVGTQLSANVPAAVLYVPEEMGYLTEGNGLIVQHNVNGAGTSMDVFFLAEEL